MKYGIIATFSDGTQKYCSSARGGHVSLSSDIDDIALFVQESSAVKALKQARKNGAERKNGCSLAVAGVEFTVAKTIDVPLPPAKTGFIIRRDNTHRRSLAEYYTGGQKIGSAYIHTAWDEDAIESATVFKSDFDAQRVVALYVSAIESAVAMKQEELEKVKHQSALAGGRHYWHKEPKYVQEELNRLEVMLEATRNAQIIAV